jgi:hypothetical protein
VLKQLSFLEDPLVAGEAPVWAVLDENQRAETVAKLGYLIEGGNLATRAGDKNRRGAGQ